MRSIIQIFVAILSVHFALATGVKLTSDPDEFLRYKFDYVVIGGGTAGLTVASRLAEKYSVGVIEAGQYFPDEPLFNIPLFLSQSLGNPSFDWGYFTTPQSNLNDRPIPSFRGKCVGGSSALNFMIWNRAHKKEYDSWSAFGLRKWGWNALVPYFMKTESKTFGETDIFPDTVFPPGWGWTSGRFGPMKIGYNTNDTFATALLKPFAQSLVNMGTNVNQDPDSGNNIGVYQTPRSVDKATGARSYANSYFTNLRLRKLVILTGATVQKIHFKPHRHGKVAPESVAFVSNGSPYNVTAKKEVVLSAGAIHTPQLLELSGIGNKQLLEGMGIDSVLDIPSVGENLQDHLLVLSDFLLKEPAPMTWDVAGQDPEFAAQQLERYQTTHDGLFASTNAGISYVPLQTFLDADTMSTLRSGLDAELAEMSPTPLQKAQWDVQKRLLDEGVTGQMEFVMSPVGGQATSNPLPGRQYLTTSSFISSPFSRGSTHINSLDVNTPPTIDPQYFKFKFDAEVMAHAAELARKITQTAPLSDFVEAPSTPGPDTTTHEQFLSFAKASTSTSFHILGTAAMASKELGGVVDDDFKVYGTSNFRIVDLSVVPLINAAHTQTLVYAMAEKAADILKRH